jgi:hypothetical protein
MCRTDHEGLATARLLPGQVIHCLRVASMRLCLSNPVPAVSNLPQALLLTGQGVLHVLSGALDIDG